MSTTQTNTTTLNAYEARVKEIEALKEQVTTVTVKNEYSIKSTVKDGWNLIKNTAGTTMFLAKEGVNTASEVVELLPSAVKHMKAYIRGSYTVARSQLSGYTPDELQELDKMVASLSPEKQQRLLEKDAVKNLNKLGEFLKEL